MKPSLKNQHSKTFQAVDPVCGMTVETSTNLKTTYKGEEYFFCNPSCLKRFSQDPAKYITVQSAEEHDCCGEKAESKGQQDALHTCPMHPEVKQMGPGSCPFCGMALEPVEVQADDEKNPELVDFTRRLKWASLFTVPLLVLAMGEMIPGFSLMGSITNYLQGLLALPVVLWAGAPLFQRGWVSLKTMNLNMFSLIALGSGVAFGFSILATVAPGIFPAEFFHHGKVGVYFEAAATIVTLVLLGQVLELKARGQTTSAIRSLLKLAPNKARLVLENEKEIDVDLEHVKPGALLRVRPGEQVPVDGVVVSGSSVVDESVITGEPIPVQKAEKSKVTAGTTNQTGSFVMEAKSVGKDTVLAQIVRLVSQAQRSRAPIQGLADRVSKWFVPSVVLSAVVTAVVWAFVGPEPAFAYALVNAVAVLIIACPCALGLATPMSIMVGTGRGAQAGVLVRNAESLETLERVDTIVLDKTGTLTEGKPKVVSLQSLGSFSESEILRAAATLEKASEHPLAGAVLRAAHEKGLTLSKVEQFRSETGEGVWGRVDGVEVFLGNHKLMARAGVSATSFSEKVSDLRREGHTTLYLALNGKAAGVLGISDPVKASTGEALADLKARGLHLVMLTGDSTETARAVADRVGINEVYSDVLPSQKSEIIQRLRSEGRKVAMVGDGINDAPALALADVGIAMGTGTDIAMQSAGITLMGGDLKGLVRAINLSHATLRNIRQNLFFAFAYNALGVPIAAGALYPFFGILLSPMIASAAMSFSSVSVVGNALRLRKARL